MQVHTGSVLPSAMHSATAISDAIAPVNHSRPVLEAEQAHAQQAQRQQVPVDAEGLNQQTGIIAKQDLDAKLDAKLEYERNTQAKQGAISSYLLNEHAEQREAISQMVGIDTYA
ncbi:hypothetical protein [Shewanella colwelliana]|uniref:hypothetical protein n=1 Tax=Shewanella colwelliana TaxID=23 RepID=UPI001BBE82AF|nr:hypothetical protein [Shewanella colwelliana]MCZ4336918.1 hypothetical protein [Shewanella colwelliana]GIU27128.1 hypothetical protein TUM4644_23760 [Shewanella colwelliana]